MKPGMHGSYLKAKKRNISSDDIKRSLTYVNGVSLIRGWWSGEECHLSYLTLPRKTHIHIGTCII